MLYKLDVICCNSSVVRCFKFLCCFKIVKNYRLRNKVYGIEICVKVFVLWMC